MAKKRRTNLQKKLLKMIYNWCVDFGSVPDYSHTVLCQRFQALIYRLKEEELEELDHGRSKCQNTRN
jgi:hypothetical protein